MLARMPGPSRRSANESKYFEVNSAEFIMRTLFRPAAEKGDSIIGKAFPTHVSR